MLTRDWLGDNWREKKAQIEASGGSFEATVSDAIARAVQGSLFPTTTEATR
jgi:hypothetical protein